MSQDQTFEDVTARDAYTFAQEYLAEKTGLAIGKLLPGDMVMFRDIATGRFAFAADFWTEFRENYVAGP